MSQLPPTESAYEMPMPAEAPRWTRVVGATSATVASLTFLCGLCVAGSFGMMAVMGETVEQKMGGPMPDVMRPGPVQLGFAAIGFVWAVLLMFAAVTTLNRKAAGRTLHLVYAVCALATGPLGAVMATLQQMAMLRWIAEHPENGWAKQTHPSIGMVILGSSILMGTGWPLFCLLWFAPKRHSPDVGAPELVA
jgi:hypothetical protein